VYSFRGFSVTGRTRIRILMKTDLDRDLGRVIPFANLLGLQLRELGKGMARFELQLRPELMNSFHAAHGGVVMTMLDIAMAYAAKSMDAHAVGAITVEMKTTFIAVGKGTLIAVGRCLHHGSTVSLCEGEITDPTGRMVARGSGTFMVRKERAAP
jgi:uncharacterized protein (TIGR00369 family)